ncbi:Uncharacterised protein [Mesomycoplasma hyorhinis]|nr:Uncharacterised protein [Mesomycoplasma hyorhinis]
MQPIATANQGFALFFLCFSIISPSKFSNYTQIIYIYIYIYIQRICLVLLIFNPFLLLNEQNSQFNKNKSN